MSLGAVEPAIAEHWPLVGRRADLERAVAVINGGGSAGIAVHGPPGVGRSRFAAELLAELADGPRRIVRTVATTSAGSVPLGALSHLLPPETLLAGDAEHMAIDPVRVLTRACEAITGGGPILIAIDDAHLLDALSLTLLQQLAEHDDVRLLVTVRSGEPEPDGLSALWRTERTRRIDLGPLEVDSVDTLLHLGLEGSVDGRAARLIGEASGGLPLLLREIVRTAGEQGSLVRLDGVWRLNGPLPTARRAVELVAAQLADLDPDARQVLELLVLAGETPLELVEATVALDVLERLEADGLIAVLPGARPGDGHTVVIARHVVGDAIRTELSPLRSRNILRTHADRYAQWSSGTPEDELRIAGWRLDAGIAADPLTLESAATLARHAEDYEATIRFAEAADRAGASLRSGVLWADALYEMGRWDECERVFAMAAEREGNAFDRLRLVSARGTNLLFGLLRGTAALEMTRAALADLDAGAPEWRFGIEDWMVAGIRKDLVSRVALLQMYSGDPAGAVETLGQLPPPVAPGDDDNIDVRDLLRSRVLWAIPGVPAIALSGRTGEAVALGYEAFGEHARLGGEVGFSSLGTHLVTLGLALQEHGDFEQAFNVLNGGYDATLSSGGILGQIWFGLNLGRIGLLTGKPETARRWAREVLAATNASGWLGPRIMALTGMAAACAVLGDLTAARAAAADAEAIEGDFGFLFPDRVICTAWILAADGRLDEARAVLIESADRACATGHLTSESWLRYESVRLGGNAAASAAQAGRLAELAANSDSALVAARSLYAAAIVADDPAQLEQAAGAMEAVSCDLAASELLSAAAEALRELGLPRAAQSMMVKANAAAERTEGARSFRLTRLDTVVPLTAREREIAGLAASGVPSKEIADRLYLSVRTVNNHLQNAYTKLGVSSRADVARILESGG